MVCPICGSDNYESKQLSTKNTCDGDPIITKIQNRCFECRHVWSPALARDIIVDQADPEA